MVTLTTTQNEEARIIEDETLSREDEAKLKELAQVVKSLANLGDIERARMNFREAEDFKVFIARHPFGAKYTYYVNLVNAIAQNPQWFVQNRQGLIARIEGESKAFADELRKVNIPANSPLPMLHRVKHHLVQFGRNKEPTWQGQQDLAQLDAFQMSDLRLTIEHAIHVSQGTFQAHLQSVLNVVEHWPTLRQDDPNRIDFFIEQLKEFIAGAEGVQKGIHTYFGDKALTEQIIKDKKIQHLWSYKEFIEFVQYFVRSIDQSVATNNWSVFLNEIYPKLDYFISIAKNKYGADDFAFLLKRDRKKFRQGAYQWDQSMKNALIQFSSTAYQNKHVVIPASEALTDLLKARIHEVSKESDKLFKNALHLLSAKIETIERQQAQPIIRLRNLIHSGASELRTTHKEVMRRFRVAETGYLIHYAEISKYVPLEDMELVDRLTRIADRENKWIAYDYRSAYTVAQAMQRRNYGAIPMLLFEAQRAEAQSQKLRTSAAKELLPTIELFEVFVNQREYIEKLLRSLYSYALQIKKLLEEHPYLQLKDNTGARNVMRPKIAQQYYSQRPELN